MAAPVAPAPAEAEPVSVGRCVCECHCAATAPPVAASRPSWLLEAEIVGGVWVIALLVGLAIGSCCLRPYRATPIALRQLHA